MSSGTALTEMIAVSAKYKPRHDWGDLLES